jgi:chromate transporter
VPALLEVFLRFLRLGVTAFGGPVAHLGYFRREFVERANWLDDAAFTEIVALCSVLPGPTSSQVGMLLGARKAGPLGAFVAWIAFTTPSAIVLAIAGWFFRELLDPAYTQKGPGTRNDALVLRNFVRYTIGHPVAYAAFDAALYALALVAIAVVALAVYNLALANVRTTFARYASVACLAIAIGVEAYGPQYGWTVLALGGLLGLWFASDAQTAAALPARRISRRIGILASFALVAALFAVPILAKTGYGSLFATTFRAGALVFGGGHVVLSFLTSLTGAGRVRSDIFNAGYGVTQAVPGPLFTFASFLGAADENVGNPWIGATIAVIGIFLPSFLILPAVLPFWDVLRSLPRAGAVLAGLNVAVVGLLGATLLNPISRPLYEPDPAMARPVAFAVVLLSFALLAGARWPAWLVVVSVCAGCALANAACAALLANHHGFIGLIGIVSREARRHDENTQRNA